LAANEYYCKLNSLILSARIDEQPVETIEIDLKNYQIVQARGRFNQNTPHHDRIMDLVKRNIPNIRKIRNSKKAN
jgi:hypothetical protein